MSPTRNLLVTLSDLPVGPEREAALWTFDSFVDDIASCRYEGAVALLAQGATTTASTLQIPIEQVPLGARVPTKNPRHWEFDDSLAEPDQGSWAKVCFTVEREDGQMVDAEMLRPQAWVDAHGIEAGKWLPLNIPELKILGAATVTAVEPCPEIACGEGSVITGRFVTRQADEIARVEILAPDGTTETLEGTPIHPIWSVDRQDWIPLGELSEGEQLQAAGGVAVVLSLTLLRRSLPVYNIEVHGEHVYQVGELGLLVHNALEECLAALRAGNSFKLVRANSEAVLKLSGDVLEVVGSYIDEGFLALVDDIRQAAKASGATSIKIRDVGFGFGTVEGKAAAIRQFFECAGTVTKTGDDILGELFEIVIKL